MYPQVFGKYVLERELSRGGMARVVLATLRGAGGFEKRLVVKQIRDELSFDQQFISRFIEEANITVALSHPNIVPVYELGVEQGTYFLAMELVEGCSIAELVRERNFDGGKRVLTPEEGAYVGMEVCRALDYAHRRMKVVHRDITPRNVMLDEEGQVKLIDFGIAAPALVAGHEILGSPGHMPPEQVEGKELGPPTDIFAVAVLLMEAWSGIAPFRRATPEECDAAMQKPHPKPSDFDPRLIPLDDVIVRAMKLDPKERQQEANELGRALRAFLQGTDVTDIARELGDRVRDLREVESDPHPMSTNGKGPMRASQASVGDLGTKTFAAREEAIRWSRPPASEVEPIIEPPGASTRRLELPQSQATPAPALLETPRTPKTVDPAMSIPTPFMVELATGSEVMRVAREQSDTLATRGLETAVRERAERDRAAPRSRLFVVLGVAALLAMGFGVAWRTRATSARADLPPSTTTPLTSATAPTGSTPGTTSARSVTADPSSSAPTAVGTPAGAITLAVPTVRGGPATSASAAAVEKAGKSAVQLLGEPGTRVSIDGASRGPTPVRVNLDPGQHEVRFIFDPTGESRGERFSVKAGERVTVRAEFTGASPTVRIQR